MAKYRLKENAEGYEPLKIGQIYDGGDKVGPAKVPVSRYAAIFPNDWELVKESSVSNYVLKLLKPSDLPLKGDIADFPLGVVEKMLENQVEQGKILDVTAFQNWKTEDDLGFDWNSSIEGGDFWNKVIEDKKFEVFLEKYPEYKNAVFSYESLHPETNKLINEKLMQYPVTPYQTHLPEHFVVKSGSLTSREAIDKLKELGIIVSGYGGGNISKTYIRIKSKVVMGTIKDSYKDNMGFSEDIRNLPEFTFDEVIEYHNSYSNLIQPFKQQQNVSNQITGKPVLLRVPQPAFRRETISGTATSAQPQKIAIASRQIEHRARAIKA